MVSAGYPCGPPDHLVSEGRLPDRHPPYAGRTNRHHHYVVGEAEKSRAFRMPQTMIGTEEYDALPWRELPEATLCHARQ